MLTIVDIDERLNRKPVGKIIKHLDTGYLNDLVAIMKISWPLMRRSEKRGVDNARYQDAKAVHFAAGIAAMRHLDDAGVTEWLRGNIELFRDFSFAGNFHNMSQDMMLLINDLAIPAGKVKAMLEQVDADRNGWIKAVSSSAFTLEKLARQCIRKCDAPGGPEWQHASPVKWNVVVFVVGAAINGAGIAVSAGASALSIALAVGGAMQA
jgi:hypothetical protein